VIYARLAAAIAAFCAGYVWLINAIDAGLR